MQVEQKTLDVRLREMFNRLTPKNSQNAHLVGVDSVHWIQPPYFHEVKLMEAYTYLVEKQVKGESFSDQDKNDVALLLDWMLGLKVDQILPLKDVGKRTIIPELMRNLAKADLRDQVASLRSPAFLASWDAEKTMLGYLRSDIVRLGPHQSGIFAVGDTYALYDTIARNLQTAPAASRK